MLNPNQSSEVKAHLKMEDDLLSALLWQYFNQVPHGFRTQIQSFLFVTFLVFNLLKSAFQSQRNDSLEEGSAHNILYAKSILMPDFVN